MWVKEDLYMKTTEKLLQARRKGRAEIRFLACLIIFSLFFGGLYLQNQNSDEHSKVTSLIMKVNPELTQEEAKELSAAISGASKIYCVDAGTLFSVLAANEFSKCRPNDVFETAKKLDKLYQEKGDANALDGYNSQKSWQVKARLLASAYWN